MDNVLTILLVEDDMAVCQNFVEYADTFEDITFVSVTNNSTKALEDIHDYLPNAIILDLELHHGSGSGLEVLQGIKDMMLDVNPYILITTNNSSSVTYEYARQLGADYILYKHQGDYSEKVALNLLRTMKNVIKNKFETSPKYSSTSGNSPWREQRIIRRITTELNQIGISPKVKGYQYLTDAIQLVIDEPRQYLCGIIGQKYGKTDSSVERAMQNAINKAWRTNDIDDLLLHFNAKISSEKGVPTITEFIYYYANKIKNEL